MQVKLLFGRLLALEDENRKLLEKLKKSLESFLFPQK